MPRARGRSKNRQDISEVWRPENYRSAERAKIQSPSDAVFRREQETGIGKQGVVECPVCHAMVKLRKYTRGMDNHTKIPSDWGYINQSKDLLYLCEHRYGGGRVNIRRGHPSCLGAGTPVRKDSILIKVLEEMEAWMRRVMEIEDE